MSQPTLNFPHAHPPSPAGHESRQRLEELVRFRSEPIRPDGSWSLLQVLLVVLALVHVLMLLVGLDLGSFPRRPGCWDMACTYSALTSFLTKPTRPDSPSPHTGLTLGYPTSGSGVCAMAPVGIPLVFQDVRTYSDALHFYVDLAPGAMHHVEIGHSLVLDGPSHPPQPPPTSNHFYTPSVPLPPSQL
ncbi:hypothetical protein P691DRAFT_791887 [Macrolepiota fuliginosa MF-IS2]|uniref:Uncharacterized protein n=1 Tax=Macrolepiota fuliginosa MF-IS2 TaxID=1400762 RepID=A0A9P5WY24_9AGAR|nr:hypothetical protein P691DRAFT_791887 [Macrolepiota fuliginosa MF-IS2]